MEGDNGPPHYLRQKFETLYFTFDCDTPDTQGPYCNNRYFLQIQWMLSLTQSLCQSAPAGRESSVSRAVVLQLQRKEPSSFYPPLNTNTQMQNVRWNRNDKQQKKQQHQNEEGFWIVCVTYRTARDTGVHLSKAGISFLGEKGFCLVSVLSCFMDPTAHTGHRHLIRVSNLDFFDFKDTFVYACVHTVALQRQSTQKTEMFLYSNHIFYCLLIRTTIS